MSRGAQILKATAAFVLTAVLLGVAQVAVTSLPALRALTIGLPTPLTGAGAARHVLLGLLLLVTAHFSFTVEVLLASQGVGVRYVAGLTRRLALFGLGVAAYMLFEGLFLEQMQGFEEWYVWGATAVLGLVGADALIFTFRGLQPALAGLHPRGAGEDRVCPECQRKNPTGSRFCEHCGTELAEVPRPVENDVHGARSGRRAVVMANVQRFTFLAGAAAVIVAGFYCAVQEAQRRDRLVKDCVRTKTTSLIEADGRLWHRVTPQTTAMDLTNLAQLALDEFEGLRRHSAPLPASRRVSYLEAAFDESLQGYSAFLQQLQTDLSRPGEQPGTRHQDVYLQAIGHARRGVNVVSRAVGLGDADGALALDASLGGQVVAALDRLYERREESARVSWYSSAMDGLMEQYGGMRDDLDDLIRQATRADYFWEGLVEQADEAVSARQETLSLFSDIDPPDAFAEVHDDIVSAVARGVEGAAALAQFVRLKASYMQQRSYYEDAEPPEGMQQALRRGRALSSQVTADLSEAWERYEELVAKHAADLSRVPLRLEAEGAAHPAAAEPLEQHAEPAVPWAGADVIAGASPIEVNGNTLVPLRAILEWLGAEVRYVPQALTITATRDGIVLILRLEEGEATINGQHCPMSQPPVERNGTAYVPVRFVAEAFGCSVGYDPATGTISITDGARTGLITGQ